VRDDVQTEVVPRSDAQTEVVTRPPDRAVTREDARRLTFEPPQEDEFADDDEPPLRPGEIPRSRDGA
jgi:hypothetical protein